MEEKQTTPERKRRTSKNKKTSAKVLSISKKSQELLNKGVRKFKKIIELAKQKNLNESDTSNIINDMLGEVW